MIKLADPTLLKSESYINGIWTPSSASFAVTNPATNDEIATVANHGSSEALQAVEAAHQSFQTWKTTTAAERAAINFKLADLLEEHMEDLATIISCEQGKPLAESRGEINYSIAFFQWFAEEARRVYGSVVPTHNANLRNIVIKQPIGVTATITPWNFPVAMVAKKLPAALAAGCTMVWKPSEETPLSGLALAELTERAGLPPGVFNVVTGLDAAAIGRVFTESPLVRKISFTGSTAVGKILLRQSAHTIKKVSLELGGNAPFIVFDDADIDAAVEGAIASKFRNAGQTCVCANRIMAQSAIYDEFVAKFSDAVSKFHVGNGLDAATTVGPLINSSALEKVERLVGDAIEGGAALITGGERHQLGGTFYQPTVLSNVSFSSTISEEEVFGPVAPIFSFQSEEEAISRANDTVYGLAAYFYARDVGRIWRVSEALEYGMVGINSGMISTPVAPFGGVKESGLGREGSMYGLDEYLELKFMCLGGVDG